MMKLHEFENNNQLFNYIINWIDKEKISISSIRKWFEKSIEHKLSTDSIIIEPLLEKAIKSILLINDQKDETTILSIIIEPVSNSLSFKDFSFRYGDFKISEITRWEISYQLEFKNIAQKKLKSIILHTLPLEITDNLPNLINETRSWLKVIELKINN